jgi:hypothetical protein
VYKNLSALVAVYLLASSTAFAEQPEWFFELSKNNYEIIGYGQGDKLARAKKEALSDISQMLKVKVQSSFSSKERLHNNEFDSDVKQNLETSSTAILTGARVTKSYQNDGIWYVAVVYDTSSLGMKFKRAMQNNKLINEPPNYLTETSLVNEINSEIGATLRFSLLRENSLWKLKYKNIKYSLMENDLVKLFRFAVGKNINLKLNKKIFYPNDNMMFSIQSQQKGYISMLYVENDGKVGVLFANKKSKDTLSYPEKGSGEELIILNPHKKVLHEMYLATWSQQKIDLSAFEDVQGDYLDVSNYKFNTLVQILDEVDYSSAVVKIKY